MFLLLLALISFWNVSVFAYEKRVYINKEGLTPTSVFNSYGFDHKTCKQSPTVCNPDLTSWPDRNSEVIDLGERVKAWVKNANGEDEEVEYAKVKVSYIRVDPKTGYLNDVNGRVGYIDVAYLTDKPMTSLYGTAAPVKATPATPTKKYCPPKKNAVLDPKVEKIEPVEEIAQSLPVNSIVNVAAVLKSEVGDCLKPSPKTNLEVTYDGYAYEHMKSKALPNVAGEDGQKITRQQFMDIDMLSRTMYSEMAKCYKYGLHYPMAVARVALNRAQAEDKNIRGEFINYKHKDKSSLGKVLTDPYMFSAWNKKIKNKDGKVIDNPSLDQALCPPQNPSKPFWKGNKELPSGDEREIWDQTVKVATEAVLFPKNFTGRTNSVESYFYTSGMDRDDMRRMSSPTIEGRSVDKPNCMRFWTDGKP
ncbi:hypothetical protein D3C72_930900 [compost metagenome]